MQWLSEEGICSYSGRSMTEVAYHFVIRGNNCVVIHQGSDSFEGATLAQAIGSFRMQKSADGIVAQRYGESYRHGEGLNPCKEEPDISRFTPMRLYDGGYN